MDDLGVRAVIIGVSIFVTITIVSLVIVMFFQMGEIYGLVSSTDTSIYNKFDNIYSTYHGRVESGIGLLNTLKKFEENPDVDIVIDYPGRSDVRAYAISNGLNESNLLKKLMLGMGLPNIKKEYKYEDRYNISVEEQQDGKIKIVFE